MVKKLYVNDKLVNLGDYTIKEVEEEPKYTIKCYYDQHDIDLTEYLNSDLYKFYTNIPKHLDGSNIDDLITGQHKNIYGLVKHLNDTDITSEYFIVYGIIHSGIALSLDSFNDPWDSGIAGILQINKENCNTDISIRKIAEDWINEINAILEDNVIRYYVFDELGEIVDCCGGFIVTNKDTTINSIYNTIPREYNITKEDITKSMNKID